MKETETNNRTIDSVEEYRLLPSLPRSRRLILHDFYFYGTVEFARQANGDAALGTYVAGSCVGAAAEYDLFVKNHAY